MDTAYKRTLMLPGNDSSANTDWLPRLSLTEQTLDGANRKRPVLYVHGFTFPSALSVFWKLDGRSWADEICSAGFSVWGLDFAGFGESERYPEMGTDVPPSGPPLGPAKEATEQIRRAVMYILKEATASRVSIVAHSRGAIVAGSFATQYPELVERLVLYGPVAKRTSSSLPYGLPSSPSELPPWRYVTVQNQYDRFVEDVPPGHPPVLLDRHFQSWARAYLATDPTSQTRSPEAVKVPNGPTADLIKAWQGQLAYEPERIICPLFIVRGEWDNFSNHDDCNWLLKAATKAPVKQYTIIKKGTHVMFLEESRHELHRITNEHLRGT